MLSPTPHPPKFPNRGGISSVYKAAPDVSNLAARQILSSMAAGQTGSCSAHQGKVGIANLATTRSWGKGKMHQSYGANQQRVLIFRLAAADVLLSLYCRMAVAFCMHPVPKTRISHVQSVSSAEITVHHLLHVFVRSESCLFQLHIHRCKAPCSGSVGGFPSQGHTLRSKQQKSVDVYLIGFFFSILHWCVLDTDICTPWGLAQATQPLSWHAQQYRADSLSAVHASCHCSFQQAKDAVCRKTFQRLITSQTGLMPLVAWERSPPGVYPQRQPAGDQGQSRTASWCN